MSNIMNNNILNIDRMNNFIASSTPRIISKIWQFTSEIIWWWMGIPSIEAIDDIQTKIPELNEFIDFDAARSRIPKIPNVLVKQNCNTSSKLSSLMRKAFLHW
jgi:hypothetical protein